MKYERLTERDEFGNADVINVNMPDVYNGLTFDEANTLTRALNRFAELEDKIESGEIISTKLEDRSEQEVRFFVEHNYGVRKLFADNLKECLRFHLVVGDITKEAHEIVMRVIRYCLEGMKE